MNFSDLTHTGGLPLTQNRIDFLQQSYLAAFAAIAHLCGSKTILYGVVNTGGVVSDGWISYDGELLPFVGGAHAAEVVIVETPAALTFADASSHDVEYTRYATCGTGGVFDFDELVPLLSLQNMWMPGDVKEKYCDAAYIAANFDPGTGVGMNADTGWQIMAFAYPDSAGKTFINYDPADGDYDEPGLIGGDKTKTLAANEQGTFTVAAKTDDLINAVGGGGNAQVKYRFNGNEAADGAANAASYGSNLTVALSAAANAHDVMNPFFVILKLVKL